MSTQNVKLRDITGSGSTDTITTTYAGEFAGDYIAAALLSGNTLANGGITIKPNVKYQEVIKKLNLTDALTAATCDFTASADKISLVERILTPTELQVNLELCKKDYRSDWEAIQMGISAYDNLPPSFADFLIGQVAAKVAESIENTIWNGEVGGATGYALFDGILHKLANATADIPDSQEVTGTTVTAANVIDELGKIVDAIPSALYGSEDLHIYIPQNVHKAYVRTLGGFAVQAFGSGATESAASVGANGVGNNGTTWYNGQGLTFDGIKMFVANGLPNNKMVAAERSNLFFGTGLQSDLNQVKVIDMADIDGSQNVRMVMRATAGVEVGVVEDVVIYS
jgi:hypothetical protein